MARYIFKTNPHKASSKVNISSFMIGGLFFVLTLIWSVSPNRYPDIVTGQLILAIPLLFVSSLAYSKIGYWKESKLWDTFAWITNTLGNGFVLNSVGLMTIYNGKKELALIYFITIAILLGCYTIINMIDDPDLLNQKIIKFIVMLAIVIFGGIIPWFIM